MFCYLQGIKNLKIMFSEVNSISIKSYSDLDYTEDTADRKFTYRYIFTLTEGAIL